MSTSDVRRILVALDASPHSHAALEEAAALAKPLQAELAGVFVLDAELLRLSALPVARETRLVRRAWMIKPWQKPRKPVKKGSSTTR